MTTLKKILSHFKPPTLEVTVFHAVFCSMQNKHVYSCQLNIRMRTKKNHTITALYLEPPRELITVFSALPIRYVFPGNRSGLYRLSEDQVLQRLMSSEDVITLDQFAVRAAVPVNVTFSGFLYPIREPNHRKDLPLTGWRLRVEYDFFKTIWSDVQFEEYSVRR